MTTLTLDHMSRVWQDNQQPLERYAMRFLRCVESAQDVVADTWIRASQCLRQFHGRGSVRNWLYSICHRICLDRLRHGRVVQRLSGAVQELESLRCPPDPEERTSARRRARRLEQAISELPDTHRRVLRLRVIEGRSARETAARLGMSPNQVDSQLSYARRCLKQKVA